MLACDPNVLTCGHCSLVCGPTLKERARRHRLLVKGGLVVRGADGRMVKADSYEQARAIRRAHRCRPSSEQRARDAVFQTRYSAGYFGIDLRSQARNLAYRLCAKRALAREPPAATKVTAK